MEIWMYIKRWRRQERFVFFLFFLWKINYCVTHTYNPSMWETEAGGCELEASLGYKVRPCLKTKKKKLLHYLLLKVLVGLGKVMHADGPSYLKGWGRKISSPRRSRPCLTCTKSCGQSQAPNEVKNTNQLTVTTYYVVYNTLKLKICQRWERKSEILLSHSSLFYLCIILILFEDRLVN
jgi:hypothetical protein